MAQLPPAEANLAHYHNQFSSDLAQARSFDQGVHCCLGALDIQFAAETAQLVWGRQPGARVFGADRTPIAQPTEGELAVLGAGRLALRSPGGQVRSCFAPLVVRGQLLGWIFLDQPLWVDESAMLLASIAGQAAPTLALLDTDARHEDRVAQLHTLNEIGRILSGVLDLETLLEAIYNATRRLVDASVFFLAFYDQAHDELELAYMAHDRGLDPPRHRWPAHVGLAGVVVRERQPLCANDYLDECRHRSVAPRPFLEQDNVRAWLGVPLLAHDRLLGVMSISSYRDGYHYTTEQAELLTTIAAQAAVAIENARLYQQSARQARHLATLNRIGRTLTSSLDPERVPKLIIEQVTELLGAEEASLMLIDPASGDLVFTYTTGPIGEGLLGKRLPRGAGLAGYVVEHGRSVIVNDVQQDERFDDRTDKTTGFVTRALLAVPLRGVGGVQGVIEALNPDGNRFSAEDQQLLEALADQAVIALENAQRFAQVDEALARRAQELVGTNARLEHNLRSLTALNALGMAINTSLRSADEIFGLTARGVVEITSALGAGVLLDEGGTFRTTVQIGPTLTQSPELLALLRQVLATGRPELVPLPPQTLSSANARHLLLVPLRATQRTLGGLCIYFADSIPDAPDRETVVLFATQAAVAVESIELFTAVRSGRDQMASILASTREGIMLITDDAQVAIANASLHQLCHLAGQLPQNMSVEHFLSRWEKSAGYVPEQWAALRRDLDLVLAGQAAFASGELNEVGAMPRAILWSVLPALGSGGSTGGTLLVLRDITEAKESERLRHDLTNMIVHDLRSPLSSVMASIEVMQKGIAGEIAKAQRNVLNIAYSSTVQMLEMINALLDVSRLESGRMPVNQQPCALGPLIEHAAVSLSSLAREQHVGVRIEVAPALPAVNADHDLVMRVIQNLLGNALKFSGFGSNVTIRASAGPALVTVAVVDQGVGIAPQDQEKIFAKFSQVGERRGGTGLGLTFCKLVVEAHNGQIWVASTPGEGSTFFFTLPVASPAAPVLSA